MSCICCGKRDSWETGTVWSKKRKKHIMASFCSSSCERNAIKILKPHIILRKNSRKKPSHVHEHNGVYCFGILKNE